MTDGSRALLAQAYKLYKEGNLNEARSLVSQVIKAEPENANAWYIVGLLSSSTTNKQQAFEKALSLDPQHKYARSALEAMKLPSAPPDVPAPAADSPKPEPAPSKQASVSQRVVQIANKAGTSASTKKPSTSVGWLLPTLLVVAIIGLVAVIALVLRSRANTPDLPVVAALIESSPTASAISASTATPSTTASATASKTTRPTKTAVVIAATPTKLVKTKAVTKTPTLTPTATVNLATLTPTATRSTAAQLTGQLLIVTNDDVFKTNVDDGKVNNLTNRSQPLIRSGRWSVDRQRIVMVANRTIVITDANGTVLQQINPAGLLPEIAVWSPDGKQIAFTGNRDESSINRFLYAVNADGSGLRQISTNGRNLQSLDWSADGKLLLYTVGGQSSVGLWGISPEGGDPQLLAPQAVPMDARWSPDGKRVLFRSTPPNMPNAELFVMDIDSGILHKFPNTLGSISAPAWSPDGTQIVYGVQDNSGYGLYVTSADGVDTPVRVAEGLAYPLSLDWVAGADSGSPAPQNVSLPDPDDRILFVKSTSNPVQFNVAHTDLYLLDAKGQQQRLTNFMQNVSDPAWSPDGRIAFVARGSLPPDSRYYAPEPPSRVYVMNVDGSGLKQVTLELQTSAGDYYDQTLPAWSPDGRYIAYVRKENAQSTLRVMDADGLNDHQVGDFIGISGSVAWSPDGRRLALYGNQYNAPGGMFVIDVDGSNMRLLTDFPGSQPVWSPDGMQIAFIGRIDPYQPPSIYLMDSEGRRPHSILQEQFQNINSVSWSPTSTTLVFSAQKNGQNEPATLYMMNVDGTDVQALTSDAQANLAPQWAPRSGGQVVLATTGTPHPNAAAASVTTTPIPSAPTVGLIAFRGDHFEGMCLAKLDGSAKRCTQKDEYVYSLRWSPDGTKLAYVSGVDPNSDIYVIDAKGKVTQLTTETRSDFAPAWSPDGSQLAFISSRLGLEQIFVMNADGSDQHAITQFSPDQLRLRYASLAWSPDGQTLLFILSPDMGLTGMYAVNADGSNLRKLNDQIGSSVVYSPDGKQVAFVTYFQNNSSIVVMNADGSDVQQLTFSLGYNAEPTWSPDGQFILFSSTRDDSNLANPPHLYVMAADGTNQHWIGELKGSSPAWGMAADDFVLPSNGAK